MLDKNFFYDREHARQYLTGCTITYKNEPVSINAVEGSRQKGIFLILLPFAPNKKGDGIGVPLDDKDLDFTPIKLGFVNWPRESKPHGKFFTVVRTARQAARRWKVGLYEGNFLVRGLDVSRPTDIGPRHLLSSVELRNTITGQMPKLDEVLKSLKIMVPTASMAFDRNFAIDAHNKLWHIHVDSSVGDVKGDKLELAPKYKFLSEQLAEAIRK